MLVLQVHAPQTCDNTIEYRQEYEHCQERKIEYKTNNHTVLKKYPSPLGYNCLDYAKQHKNLPKGLYTLHDKISKIKTHKAELGSVGVTSEGNIGHLVVIDNIEDNYYIISESNYIRGYITTRRISKSMVLGFL